jgi:hypothetical protein
MRIEVLDSAQQDLLAGYAFYERQAYGLGSYFLDSLFSDIDSLRLFAGVHAVHFGRYHRLLSKRFPFAICRLEADTVRIRAILDCRQDPRMVTDCLKA